MTPIHTTGLFMAGALLLMARPLVWQRRHAPREGKQPGTCPFDTRTLDGSTASCVPGATGLETHASPARSCTNYFVNPSVGAADDQLDHRVPELHVALLNQLGQFGCHHENAWNPSDERDE